MDRYPIGVLVYLVINLTQTTTKGNGSAIQTIGLSKAFGDFMALKSLNLEVPKNSVFAFLGPNGAGKTTTIKLLLGLTRPSAGGGVVLGHDLVSDSKRIRSRIGYMAQNQHYSEMMTPRQTLRFAARFFYEGQDADVEERIEELLELVDLTSKADRRLKGFSGGERQRLGIAQSFINDPELLILDEPAAGLDPQGREEVLELMDKLRDRTTIFYSTHILDDAQRVSDRVAILNQGMLVANASMKELLAGQEGTVYTLTLKGNLRQAYEFIIGQPWVNSIHAHPINGKTVWSVSVNDDSIAEEELLRLVLMEESISVYEFGMKKYELEEIFLKLVEESKNGN